MKHHKKRTAVLAVAAMILTAVAASPAIAEGESREPRESEDPAAASQPARSRGSNAEDATATSTVAQEAPPGADNLPLGAPPIGIPAPDTDTNGSPDSATLQDEVTHCHYLSRVDRPHISANQRDVSVHGWWHYYSGNCKKATVQLWLYHYRCVPDTNQCHWAFTAYDRVKEMPKKAPLYARANARYPCESFARKVGFKAVVDVDIDDLSDPPDRASIVEDVYCVPW